MTIRVNYESALNDLVQRVPEHSADRKLSGSYHRILLQSGGEQILSVVWKESDFVNEDSIAAAGLVRVYKGKTITAHGLATDLSERPKDVARMNSKVRKVGLAATHFGLFERRVISETTVESLEVPDNWLF